MSVKIRVIPVGVDWPVVDWAMVTVSLVSMYATRGLRARAAAAWGDIVIEKPCSACSYTKPTCPLCACDIAAATLGTRWVPGWSTTMYDS